MSPVAVSHIPTERLLADHRPATPVPGPTERQH